MHGMVAGGWYLVLEWKAEAKLLGERVLHMLGLEIADVWTDWQMDWIC